MKKRVAFPILFLPTIVFFTLDFITDAGVPWYILSIPLFLGLGVRVFFANTKL